VRVWEQRGSAAGERGVARAAAEAGGGEMFTYRLTQEGAAIVACHAGQGRVQHVLPASSTTLHPPHVKPSPVELRDIL